jgi:hypothetical protein
MFGDVGWWIARRNLRAGSILRGSNNMHDPTDQYVISQYSMETCMAHYYIYIERARHIYVALIFKYIVEV